MITETNDILEPGLFWFWNQTPSIDGINVQLGNFLSRGIRSLYIHPMPRTFRRPDFFDGMELEYLSDEYFELIAAACEAMRRRDMILWLYDEGGWPSGMAGGAVVRENPQFGIWTLHRQEGALKPKQHWPECLYPDLMNRQAAEYFIQSTHEKYYKAIGHEFGRTVKGIFTDEPRLFGRIGTDVIPWSPSLPAAFESDHGCPLGSVLHHCFVSACTDEAHKYQRAYLQTISKLIAENFYKPIRRWCDSHTLLFEGHFSGESDFSRHGFYFGNYFQQAKHFHIPGVDTINRQIFPGVKSGNFALLASSVKWLDGKCAAVSESGAVYGAGLTLAQMKWIAAYQIVRGIDRIGFMPALYAATGSRRISICSDFSLCNPQMRDFGLLSSFIKKTLQFCNGGAPLIRVGVFYRSEMINNDAQASRFDAAHEQLLENLLNQQAGVIMIDVSHLKQAAVVEGELSLNSMRLSLLVVHMASPPEQEECEIFNRLLREGLAVVYVGSESQWRVFRNNIESPDSPALTWVNDVNRVRVNDLSFVKLEGNTDGIRIFASQDGNEYKILIFNQNLAEVSVSFRIPALNENSMLAETAIDDAPYNACHPLTLINGKYTLHLYGSEMRAFQTSGGAIATQRSMSVIKRPFEQKWEVFEQERFTICEEIRRDTELKPAAIDTLGDYSSQNPSFSGTLQYTAAFDWDVEKYDKVFLDLGRVYYNAEVAVNGSSCGRRAWEPFIFEITHALRRGMNHLAVRVTNTLANQWADPSVRAADFEKYRNSYLEATRTYIDESCHAGLSGPVRLMICNYV